MSLLTTEPSGYEQSMWEDLPSMAQCLGVHAPKAQMTASQSMSPWLVVTALTDPARVS